MNNIKRATIGTTKGTKTGKQVVGKLGEDIACTFLVKHGFSVVERNFRQKCGEIDIIAQKRGVIYFIEVKSIVIRETRGYRPEENIHFKKIERFKKAVQLYLLKRNISHETPFCIHGVSIFLNNSTKKASVRMVENINIG